MKIKLFSLVLIFIVSFIFAEVSQDTINVHQKILIKKANIIIKPVSNWSKIKDLFM